MRGLFLWYGAARLLTNVRGRGDFAFLVCVVSDRSEEEAPWNPRFVAIFVRYRDSPREHRVHLLNGFPLLFCGRFQRMTCDNDERFCVRRDVFFLRRIRFDIAFASPCDELKRCVLGNLFGNPDGFREVRAERLHRRLRRRNKGVREEFASDIGMLGESAEVGVELPT